MITITACSTKGIKFPSCTTMHNHIINKFKDQMKALSVCLNVSHSTYSNWLDLNTGAYSQVKSVGILASPAMPGLPPMGTATSRWLATGLKNSHWGNGCSNMPFLASHSWTLHLMVPILGRLYSTSVATWESFIKYVLSFLFMSANWYHFLDWAHHLWQCIK